MTNPFIIKAYESKYLFCDREKELQSLLQNCLARTNTTIISQRRIGKTGLIMRLFDELNALYPDIKTIYLDIFASKNIDDFIKLLAEATMRAFKPKSSAWNSFMRFIKALRPQFSFDPITGEPQLQISYQTAHEKEYTLRSLIEHLDSQKMQIVLAIDEFQQIREYPEQNIEALLRTYIQHTKNIAFIFCGSKKHLMTDIFANSRKPFYSSTAFLSLNKISENTYKEFIIKLLSDNNRTIDHEALDFIIEWTRRHTFYTQQLCHTVFENGCHNITIKEVKLACAQLLQQGEAFYLQYRQMLTDKQWKFLIAIAKEQSIRHITAGEFLQKYHIGTPSTARKLTDSLFDKGLIYIENTPSYTEYSIDDVFLSHWLERL